MKLLFADKFPELRLAELSDQGHECRLEPDLNAVDLPIAIGDAEVLIVRSTKVTAETLAAAPNLGMIIRAGAGTNTIDKQAAADRGIYVCNVPGKNNLAVAELTMGLLLAIDRRIPDAVADLRASQWDKASYSKAEGVAGKRLGIIGLGAIGLAVASRATAFEMDVIAVERPTRSDLERRDAAEAGVSFVDDLDELLATSDVVSVHVPLTDETRGMVNAGFLAKCRDGAWIINTSRGEVVDEPALIQALDERGMRAGLDVFADEPGASQAGFRSALAQHPRTYGTHHIGASTEQAQRATAQGVMDVLTHYVHGEIRNCVNLETQMLGSCALVVRHKDRVGVLSSILQELKEAGFNVKQMDNRIFLGSEAAVATIRVAQTVTAETADRIRALENVLNVMVEEIA